MAAVAAVLAGLVMLGGAVYFSHRAKELAKSEVQSQSAHDQALSVATRSSVVEDFARQLPAYSTHLDDASLIFTLAAQQGVNLGPINYRTEVNPSLPVIVRLVDVRLEEDYPKLKAFVAALLRKLPHLYLEELRVEQGSAPTAKVQATLKLSLVYQAETGGSR